MADKPEKPPKPPKPKKSFGQKFKEKLKDLTDGLGNAIGESLENR